MCAITALGGLRMPLLSDGALARVCARLLEQGLHLHGALHLALPPARHVLTELGEVMDLFDFLLSHVL